MPCLRATSVGVSSAQALRDDLALLLERPNPATLAARDDLDPRHTQRSYDLSYERPQQVRLLEPGGVASMPHFHHAQITARNVSPPNRLQSKVGKLR